MEKSCGPFLPAARIIFCMRRRNFCSKPCSNIQYMYVHYVKSCIYCNCDSQQIYTVKVLFCFSIVNHINHKVFFLQGNLKVMPLFLQQDSCPRLWAVSRNESIVKSNSAALMTGVLIGHQPGNMVHSCSQDWPPPAVLKMITADLRKLKGAFPLTEPNLLSVFPFCKVTGS